MEQEEVQGDQGRGRKSKEKMAKEFWKEIKEHRRNSLRDKAQRIKRKKK